MWNSGLLLVDLLLFLRLLSFALSYFFSRPASLGGSGDGGGDFELPGLILVVFLGIIKSDE